MPIFQDPDRVISSFAAAPPAGASPVSDNGDRHPEGNASHFQQWGETELADVDMTGTSPTNCQQPDHFHLARLRDNHGGREEYIQSIKRRQGTSWKHPFSLEKRPYQADRLSNPKPSAPLRSDTAPSSPPSSNQPMSGVDVGAKDFAVPLPVVERPRSALHSGDFTEGQQPQSTGSPTHHHRFHHIQYDHAVGHRFSTSPTTPWYFHSFSSAVPPTKDSETSPLARQSNIRAARARAPSLGSFSSSYVLKAPTSPLVHQANNADLDFSPESNSSDLSPYERSNRRRTLPPETFAQARGSPPSQTRNVSFGKSFAFLQREESLPSQAHQPRRSSAYSLQPASSPHTQFRPRRPSLASDLSPCIHAPMVGSYEESILRGRMSTSPSKPLDFTAQIGVMGRGKCKGSLRCPPHISVPFPAVFYSYPTSGAGRSISDDSPSPYVGLIDLENSITLSDSAKERKKHSYANVLAGTDHMLTASSSNEPSQNLKRGKRSSRPEGLKTPPGGSYRIPQRGQLQIVIKNPHKTAVKLFLVPYDLDGMEPGTKTFIRQRSYSAGPMIDMPLTARKNLGTDRPEASLNSTDDPKDKPILRYLIHLNICCTAKGRFYLYSTIRVVFANRVPDGKEKLRNEIQYPEPRYSPYRPVKESSTASLRLGTEDPFRRRSAVAELTPSHVHDTHHHSTSHYQSRHSPPASPTCKVASMSGVSSPVFPFTFSAPKLRRNVLTRDAGPSTFGNPWEPLPPTDNPCHHNHPPPPPQFSDSSSIVTSRPSTPPNSLKDPQHDTNSINTTKNNSELYNKLQKGEAGYGGGYPYCGHLGELSSDSGESLLAQKLKDWTCNK